MTQVDTKMAMAEAVQETANPDFERLMQKDYAPKSNDERFIQRKDSYWEIAGCIHDSHLYSKKFQTQYQVFVVILYGKRFGWDSTTSLDNCAVIEGKVCPSASAILGICIQNGAKLTIKESGRNKEEGAVGDWQEVTMSREGWDPVTIRWDDAMVKAAGLMKDFGNHKKYPSQMKRWRCITDAAKVLYADKLSGVSSIEEMAEEFAHVPADPNPVPIREKKARATIGDTTPAPAKGEAAPESPQTAATAPQSDPTPPATGTPTPEPAAKPAKAEAPATPSTTSVGAAQGGRSNPASGPATDSPLGAATVNEPAPVAGATGTAPAPVDGSPEAVAKRFTECAVKGGNKGITAALKTFTPGILETVKSQMGITGPIAKLPPEKIAEFVHKCKICEIIQAESSAT